MVFNKTYSNYLRKNRLLNDVIIDEMLKKADEKSQPLYLTLIEEKIYDEEKSFRDLSIFLGVKTVSIQISELNSSLIAKIPLEKLITYSCVPYEETERNITFGCSEPLHFEDVRNFRQLLGKNVVVLLITRSNAQKIISYISNDSIKTTSTLESQSLQKGPEKEADIDITDDAPVVKLCDSILVEAVELGASDIHIEPYENRVRERLRIDGSLIENTEIPMHLFQAVLARFKIMAGMNIAERRVPQDGKISLTRNNIRYDFRVSTLPTIFGEKIVIRIYNTSFNSADFSLLGFDQKQSDLIHKMISRPHGILLLTGPTGSGKSTTLYSFLRQLNTPYRNIITVEDPVENQIEGINQVQVNNKANMTFSNALRAILRQDPNVIMIGEIRDEETAQIAVRAAITGHLVLSTIHTNDAVSVVGRLINMGLARYLVSDALLGSISQRLVKKLCPQCKRKVITTISQQKAMNLDQPAEIYEKVGCKFCNNTGYSGRLGLFEIMVNTPRMKQAIMNNNFTSLDLEKISNEEGKITMLEEAKKKVLKGLIPFSEYDRLSESIIKEEK